MRKRWIFASAGLVVLIGLAYAASPLWAAYQIRQAALDADSATLDARIEWVEVRRHLKQTMRGEVSERFFPPLKADGEAGALRRIAEALAPRVTSALIDRYVTPEGLPRLVAYREGLRERTGAAQKERSRPVTERGQEVWSRLRRARFTSPTRFEVELASRKDPARGYGATLELRSWRWKLVRLEFVGKLTE